MPSEYEKSGVEAKKEQTKAAIKAVQLEPSLFPDAFCQIYATPFPNTGLIMHMDGAGSKSIVNYLMYKEHNEPRWIRDNAYDVVAMNADDIICVGADTSLAPWYFANNVSINKLNCDKKAVLEELLTGYKECVAHLKDSKLTMKLVGGETADLPDQVGTFDFSACLNAYIKLDHVIDGSEIQPGDIVVGLRSDGQAKSENRLNSGMMSNGITVTRLKLLSNQYQKEYPEIAKVPAEENRYAGKFKLDDYIDEVGMTVGEAITSPTRIFAPVFSDIMEDFTPHGMVHITGGGWTKPLSQGKDVHYQLELEKIAPWFEFIQKNAGIGWDEMPEDYNLGVGFLVIVPDEYTAEDVIDLADWWGIEAQELGRVEKSKEPGKNTIELKHPYGTFKSASK